VAGGLGLLLEVGEQRALVHHAAAALWKCKGEAKRVESETLSPLPHGVYPGTSIVEATRPRCLFRGSLIEANSLRGKGIQGAKLKQTSWVKSRWGRAMTPSVCSKRSGAG